MRPQALRHLGARLGEAEDFVDEESGRPCFLLVAEYFGDRQGAGARPRPPRRGSFLCPIRGSVWLMTGSPFSAWSPLIQRKEREKRKKEKTKEKRQK